MFTRNIKKLFFTLIATSLLIVIGNTTEAKYNPVSRQICSLAVAPYNPTSPSIIGLAADQYLNYLGTDTCNNFVKLFDKAYTPQPPKPQNNPTKSGSEDKNVPTIRHDHAYYNDTIQDDNFYYKSFVKKFEITLQPDTVKNIDLSNIKCDTFPQQDSDIPKFATSGLINCSGSQDLWGGTTISKEPVGDKIVITWTFGTQTHKNIPRIWANNGPNFDYGSDAANKLNFADENNRKFPFSVHLPTKDNGQIWSATTTSRVLVADQAVHKLNYQSNNPSCVNNNVNDSDSGWCYIDPKNNGPTKDFVTETVITGAHHTFYWFPIGSVATVWKKFTPPNVCQSLTAKLYDNSIQVNGANAYPLSVSGITFAPQNMIPAETELKWTTDDPKGKFYEVIIGYSAAKDGPKHTIQNELTKNSDGTVNTDPDATIYYVGKPESKITVTLDKIPASQIGPQCNAQIVSPAAPECKEILVDHQEHIYEGTYSYFKAKSLDVDNKDLKAKIRYSVDPGYGEFYVIKPSDYDSKKNNSKIIFEATPSDQIVPFGSNTIPGFKIDPKILILGNLGDQIPISMIDIDTKIATGKFGIQDLSQNITDPGKLSDAVKKGNIILPDWMVSGLPPSTNPVDPFINPLSDQTYDSNPGKFGLNDVFNIDPNIAIGGQKIDVSKPNTEIINAKTYFINSLFETITVDPGTTVYFYAKKAGKGVIHVKTIGSAVGVCEKNYDIEAVCSKFSLTGDPAGLTVGQNATLKVTAKDNLGKNLPGSTNIKLSTDTQGTFNNTTLSDIIAKYSDPLTFKNSKKPGTITASIDPKDPLYNDVCKDSIPINPAPVAQCTAIHLTLNDASSGTPATQLEKNKKYIVSATIDTSAANGDKITYSIDPNYGYFIYVDISKPPSLTPISQITLDEVKAFPLILVTYDNVPSTPIGLIKDVLKVQGTGYGNECATSIPFNNPGVCKSITLTPNQNGFDPTNNNPQDSNPNDSGTTFLIGGDFSSHPGPIQVSINSSGGQGTKPTIKRANTPSQETGNGSISFTADEVKNSNNQLSFVYTRNNFGDSLALNENSLEKLDINVNAVGSAENLCNQPIHKEVAGKTVCVGGDCQNPNPNPNPPKFEKFAYPDDKVEKASKEAININKNTQFVTYVLKFTAGSEKLNEVSIADQSMQNGIIWKDKEKDHNFQKSGYLNFNSIKSIQYAVNEGQNAQSLSKCTTSQTDACIGTDPGNIDNNFKNKDYISFKNLKANSVTYITYTMWYKNGVYLNQRCRDKLKAKDGGCGEQFENSAKYRIGNNSPVFSNKVKVIAICPYVLTRQGGDTFFHDVINTGIDVSQCFEVKNCEGPCITPETPGEQKNVNTGQGDYAGPLLLKSPSHDVCSASNNDSNGIKAYQNVLENFSSSICELRTDVAKAWTKQNITDAINANVKRLSRFEANLNDIGQISSTSQLPQDQSGVFVKTNGDLTIDNDIQDYAIGNSIDGLPAAQTYIVIGHDLIIKSNIVYDNSTNFIQTFNKKSIASAAFIVIGGNIEIDNSVDHIDGILMAVDKQGVGGGEVRSTEDKTTDEKPLNINGNLIGNVINLFTNRQYAGDPLQDDGSINIHYDERILLNPPPGINELINLQQVVVPN